MLEGTPLSLLALRDLTPVSAHLLREHASSGKGELVTGYTSVQLIFKCSKNDCLQTNSLQPVLVHEPRAVAP